MMKVTKQIAPIEYRHLDEENDETLTQLIIPEMVSTLRCELIFGQDKSMNIKKAGTGNCCTPRTYEMHDQGN